ncbi:1184_t:CDS:2, partial [Funneliformis caledonium]
IAIEGCCHNQLEQIYKTLNHIESVENIKIDLLLICGDFQSIRNIEDYKSLAVPVKYQKLGTFYKYYTGELKAPYPTLFIGGNHEVISYLWEIYYGGWVCENIYFLGYGGVVHFGGLRIGGLSGIYNPRHYNLGHFETLPYSESTVRSAYHVREYDVFKLSQIRNPLDIFLSHDWPRQITNYGDLETLLRFKPHFESDIKTGKLGSAACDELLFNLKPKYWFAAHLHVKFSAIVYHGEGQPGINNFDLNSDKINIDFTKDLNPDEINIDLDEDFKNPDETKNDSKNCVNKDEIFVSLEDNNTKNLASPVENVLEQSNELVHENSKIPQITPSNSHINDDVIEGQPPCTKFLSLDKCLPGRDFLQILDFPEANGLLEFSYDEEWLAITRATQEFLSLSSYVNPLPSDEEIRRKIDTELQWVRENISQKKAGLVIPHNFQPTAPAYGQQQTYILQKPFKNPQTEAFTKLLNIQNKINPEGQIPSKDVSN